MWGLLLYDPEGGINCRNVVPMPENWAAFQSTLPKRCLFNLGRGANPDGFSSGGSPHPLLACM